MRIPTSGTIGFFFVDGASVLSDFSVATVSDPKIIKYKNDPYLLLKLGHSSL